MKKEFDANLSLEKKTGREMRVDWLMRQFVDGIIQKLENGMSKSEAKKAMTNRGIPNTVQAKILYQYGSQYEL